ncbi:hypothetical protein PL81_08785 [Streptomyces sp. RSD-27]|nr:hypothetical protein PL81_08785 [Streptomyces sp. RSD-27]
MTRSDRRFLGNPQGLVITTPLTPTGRLPASVRAVSHAGGSAPSPTRRRHRFQGRCRYAWSAFGSRGFPAGPAPALASLLVSPPARGTLRRGRDRTHDAPRLDGGSDREAVPTRFVDVLSDGDEGLLCRLLGPGK